MPIVLPLTVPTIITGIAGGKRIDGVMLEVIGAAFDMSMVVGPMLIAAAGLDVGKAVAPIGANKAAGVAPIGLNAAVRFDMGMVGLVAGAMLDMVVDPTGLIAGPGIDMVVPTGLVAAAEIDVGRAGFAEKLVLVAVTLITDGESSTAVGEQFTIVPGMVGSCASGGEARVVAGAPGTVAAEKRLVNGLGPPKGDDTIAPGVVGIPNAVVPMVDICAIQQLLLSKVTIIAPKVRMSNLLRRQSPSAFMSSWARVAVLLWLHPPDPPLD